LEKVEAPGLHCADRLCCTRGGLVGIQAANLLNECEKVEVTTQGE
jgi:hypothetical protein